MITFRHTILAVALLLASLSAQGKQQDVFVFGVAISFNDSIVCITDIQEVKQASITDNREKFLVGRDGYSRQLREHLAAQGLANRTCTTFWATSRKAIEKKYAKVMAKYTPSQKKKKKSHKTENIYEVRQLTADRFAYKAVAPDEGTVYVDATKAEQAAKESKRKEQKATRHP